MNYDAFAAAITAFATANQITEDEAADLFDEIGDTPTMSADGTKVIAQGREWIWPLEEE